MPLPKELTKEYLQRVGITNITKDGDVYINGHIRTNTILTQHHKYGKDIKYRAITVYDPELRKLQKEQNKHVQNGVKVLILSRVMWAWYYNVAPAYLDIDHINGDSLDDRLENYQLLTRSQNLRKRKGARNQWQIIKQK